MTEEQRNNLENWEGASMLTMYFIIGLSGLVIGSIGTAKFVNSREPEPEPPVVVIPPDPNDSEVLQQLTDLDILVEPCSSDYIGKNGDLLCREMYCRVMTRGVDSQTSGQECEQISNVANSKLIVNHCETFIENREDCYEKYRERK